MGGEGGGRGEGGGSKEKLCLEEHVDMTWEKFWKTPPKDGITPEVATPAPWGEFLKTMRAGQPDPKIKVR